MLLGWAASSPWVFRFPAAKGDTLEGAPRKPVMFASGSSPVLSAPGAKRTWVTQGCGREQAEVGRPVQGTQA